MVIRLPLGIAKAGIAFLVGELIFASLLAIGAAMPTAASFA